MQDQMTDSLLREIFMLPSNQVHTERFAANAVEAGCSGKCHSGHCYGISETK